MPAYANPFRRGYTPGFQPQTDAGRAMALSAAALMSGPTPNEVADREALAESRRAEAALRQAQTGKADSERAILEARRRLLEGEGMDETVAYMAGTTVPGVRTARDYTLGTPGVQTMPPAGPALEAIQRAQAALRTGAMDNTVDPLAIARARGEYDLQGRERDVLEGRISPTQARQAGFGVRGTGAAPFNNTASGTMNVLDGTETINPVGEAKIGHLNAQTGAQDALALANRALAGERGARTTEITTLMPDRGALLRAQADAQKATAGLRDTQADAGGFRPPAPGRGAQAQAVKPLSKTETEVISATIKNLVGGDMDPQLSASLMAQATKLAQDPASDWHRNPAGAAEAAVQAAAPQGFESRGVYGFRKRAPVGATAPVPGQHPGIDAAKRGETAGVPPAPQRVKDRVYNTPRGPMKWTGTGWVPADA